MHGRAGRALERNVREQREKKSLRCCGMVIKLTEAGGVSLAVITAPRDEAFVW